MTIAHFLAPEYVFFGGKTFPCKRALLFGTCCTLLPYCLSPVRCFKSTIYLGTVEVHIVSQVKLAKFEKTVVTEHILFVWFTT